MITALGIFLRKLRLDNGEILKDMADKLDVSSAFLSAVENGKKKMPEKWFEDLQKLYSLNDSKMDELRQAELESKDCIELDVSKVSSTNKELAISLARQFETLDEDTSRKIIKMLNSRKGG